MDGLLQPLLVDALPARMPFPDSIVVRDLITSLDLARPVMVDARVAATAVEPYLVLLQRVGRGLNLTAAGYLPPAVVQDLADRLNLGDEWIGKMNREDQTAPVFELRESAQHLGLLRKARGRLSVTGLGTKLAADPVGLWRHLASRLPTQRAEISRDAGLLLLLAVATGQAQTQDSLNDVLANGMANLGWRSGDGRHLDGWHVRRAAEDTETVLHRLGYLPTWKAPPIAEGSPFAREALRGARPPAPKFRRRAPDPGDLTSLHLRVVLADSNPLIWRDLVVPASLTLADLHEVLQTAMGWTDSHLHQFIIDGRRYGNLDDDYLDEPSGDPCTPLSSFDQAQHLVYEYDFGDSWEHDIVIRHTEATTERTVPHLTDGAGACPPEDCGGIPGYEHLLAVLAEPTHHEHEALLAWAEGPIDPDDFDLNAKNELLAYYDRHTRH